ncbi:MAG: DUF3604 domain-containing protein [Deltaproteobacteria bacterium]
MLRQMLIAAAGLLFLAGVGFYFLGQGSFGRHEGAGTITRVERDPALRTERETERARATRVIGGGDRRILFGDLHVHTTFSADAYVMSLPLVSGEGAHPPADACDFARHCAALDFWSINDHAESLTPQRWQETIDSIRQCNAVTDPNNPDTTAFLGWEWTQDGTTPENHWGHKNIILRDLDDASIPARPIAARQSDGTGDIVNLPPMARAGLALLVRDRRTLDFTRFLAESEAVPPCPEGLPVRELPLNCRESTATPGELFAKLDDWGVASLVIPHGTTWGNTAPPAANWDAQIAGANADPARQMLVEIYSGHGSSEQYRSFRAHNAQAAGAERCPEPTPGAHGFLPNCWRAGEIIRARCLTSGESEEECDTRAEKARANHAAVGRTGFRTVPGAVAEDWLDAGQCRDCFLPAFDYRPAMSAQYMLARSDFSGPVPRQARPAFIAASDNHTARPGTGYKEYDRSEMSEGKGPRVGAPDILGNDTEALPYSVALEEMPELSFGQRDVERMSSFFTTGGLVAVHAEGGGREAIWDAMQRKEVYATSGDRILLYFDLLNAGNTGQTSVPMGSEVQLGTTPRFRAAAMGALRQQPGCPASSAEALGAARLHALCRDECHNPGDERKRIVRIEVVRVRPQLYAHEKIAERIDDPWLVLPCPADGNGCSVEFEDPSHADAGRTSIYYVRAIEEPSPAVNGGGLRCLRDEQGVCVGVQPCFGNDAKTPYQDDCLAPVEERAWSSPIWIDPPTGATSGVASFNG